MLFMFIIQCLLFAVSYCLLCIAIHGLLIFVNCCLLFIVIHRLLFLVIHCLLFTVVRCWLMTPLLQQSMHCKRTHDHCNGYCALKKLVESDVASYINQESNSCQRRLLCCCCWWWSWWWWCFLLLLLLLLLSSKQSNDNFSLPWSELTTALVILCDVCAQPSVLQLVNNWSQQTGN